MLSAFDYIFNDKMRNKRNEYYYYYYYYYNGSRHDCYPQFPRSPLGTSGTMADHLRKTDGKKTAEVLDSRSAKASLTN